MDIHKPKPVHNLREFFSEITVVVCGIVIALVGEQIIDRLEWAHRAHLAESAMTEEIAIDDGPQMLQRVMLHPCLSRQADLIRAAADGDAPRATIAARIDGYQTEFLTYETLARDAANASGVALHFPASVQNRWDKIYAGVASMDHIAAKEAGDIGRLKAFRRIGGAVSDSERDNVLEGLEAVRSDELIMFNMVDFGLKSLREAHLTLDPERVKLFGDWARARYSGCLNERA